MADPNTPTPRTDAEYSLSEHESSKEHYTSEGRAKHSKRGWDFARQLERELDDLRHDIERHVAALSAEVTESERLRQQLAEERKAREEAEFDKADYKAMLAASKKEGG